MAEKRQKLVNLKLGFAAYKTPSGEFVMIQDVVGHSAMANVANNKIPDPDSLGSYYKVSERTERVTIKVREITPAFEAVLNGGDLVLTGSMYIQPRKTYTVASNTVTLTGGGGTGESVDGVLSVRRKSDNHLLVAVAAASEVAGESYSIADEVLTFAAGDEGKEMEISHIYSKDATATVPGEKLVIPAASAGSNIELILMDILHDLASEADVNHKILDYQRCKIDGDLPRSLDKDIRSTEGVYSLSFVAENVEDGDVAINYGYPHVDA